ncbi:hypothetical protein MMP66_04065 [Acinetobacter dispersus]|nr:hypothetical protein [Acinetobacter dispersus]MCH7393453.1 hypothetical protein [Acinetobacter dispersus]
MKIKQFLTFSLIALSGFNAYANSNQIPESRTQYQLTAAPIVQVEKKHQIASGVWLIPDPRITTG